MMSEEGMRRAAEREASRKQPSKEMKRIAELQEYCENLEERVEKLERLTVKSGKCFESFKDAVLLLEDRIDKMEK